ncbi:MDR family MFS transporter [Streptomyces sp. NPDC040750]|uniref:MDR family MFS transporter n=1 Tax=unclassified Streptomyces TaxID=2593676 RepID=UPI0033FFA875
MENSAEAAPAAADAAPALPSPRQAALAIAGVMAGMLLSALDQTVVSVALPSIVGELGGLERLPWVVTVYLVASMAVTPLWGKVSDLYGRRTVVQCAIGVFVVGSVLCGSAQSIWQLIVFRGLQGLGAGGLFVLALAVIADVVPPERRGRYQGMFGAVFGLSSVVGPLVGGWFTDGPGWRWIFLINVPVGVLALVATAVGLRIRTPQRPHTVDFAGAALVAGSVVCALLYLNWAGDAYGWAAPGSLLLAVGAVALAALFVWAETRAAEPVIPMGLFRNPVFGIGALFGLLAGAAMFAGIVFLPLYFQAVMGMSSTRSGLAMLPAMFGLTVTSIASGQLISKSGRYKVFPVSGSALLVVTMLLLSRLTADTPYWQIGLYAFLFGAGVGLVMQPVITAVQNSVPPQDIGAATSAANFFQRMGSAVGVAVLGTVLTSRVTDRLADVGKDAARAADQGVTALHRLPEPVRGRALDGYAHAMGDMFLVCVLLVAVALVVSLFLKEMPRRSDPAAEQPAQEAPATG